MRAEKLVLPGLDQWSHTRAHDALGAGLKDDVTLEEWLTKFIFPAEAKNVNEEFVRWGTAPWPRARTNSRRHHDVLRTCITLRMPIAEETKAAGNARRVG